MEEEEEEEKKRLGGWRNSGREAGEDTVNINEKSNKDGITRKTKRREIWEE